MDPFVVEKQTLLMLLLSELFQQKGQPVASTNVTSVSVVSSAFQTAGRRNTTGRLVQCHVSAATCMQVAARDPVNTANGCYTLADVCAVRDRRMLAAQPVGDDIMIVIRNRLSTLTPQSGLTPTSLWTSVLDGANFTAIAAANGLDATLTYYNATITYHTVMLLARQRSRLAHRMLLQNCMQCEQQCRPRWRLCIAPGHGSGGDVWGNEHDDHGIRPAATAPSSDRSSGTQPKVSFNCDVTRPCTMSSSNGMHLRCHIR